MISQAQQSGSRHSGPRKKENSCKHSLLNRAAGVLFFVFFFGSPSTPHRKKEAKLHVMVQYGTTMSVVLCTVFFASTVLAAPEPAAPEDQVATIPGYGTPRAPIYAGTLPVDPSTRDVKLFYIFSSMLAEPDTTTPIILWLQGGGGASPPWGDQTGPFALDGYAGGGPSTFGMLCEKIGPFSNPDNSTGSVSPTFASYLYPPLIPSFVHAFNY